MNTSESQAQISKLVSFIWNIANDVLVHAFEKGDYKKIILPMLVLRRIDILLEPTKQLVLDTKKMLDENHVANQEPVLFSMTGYPFCNTSRFTMKTLNSNVDPMRLKMDFLEYLKGFSEDVQDIIEKMKLRNQIDSLTETGRLGGIIEKFTDKSINLGINPILDDNGEVRLPGLDNHTMGTIFEELLRRFNEENSVTEAGEHFTPRDYVELLAQLAVEPIKDQLESSTYSIYDAACGTGGILTISKQKIEAIAKENQKEVVINIFGQELQADTYATCKADMMIAGDIRTFNYPYGGENRQYIGFGSTISQDRHPGETFDFCISNPPFGTPWKEDFRNWGLTEKEKKNIPDERYWQRGYAGIKDFNFIPGIGDPQMLFLANNVSRMKADTKLGTRIVEVHNGSSLFTGDAGGGESNLRRYIIEQDMLEAIIAMPENDFYNTGINTYIWVVTNRKEARRKGKVQLIDATKISTPLRKNLGAKNCQTTQADRDAILKLLMDFEENEQSKIFLNEEFGYWKVELERLERDEQGEPVKDKKGKPVYKKVKNESEQIPLLYPGGIEAFYENEVKPYDPDVRFLEPVIGYELSFTKYFYKPVQLPELTDLMSEIEGIEKNLDGLLNSIMTF